MLEASLPAAWGQVLEHVELALKQAEAQAIERERTSPGLDAKADMRGDREAHWQGCLTRMQTRTQVLQSGMQQIEQKVQEVDIELEEREEALQQWRGALQSLGQDLAKWAARGVE
ncbi:MAG TPA: hypothetical protein VGY66_20570 [Gemmataceae bacterium]|jgi:chromosome segregation ATPase|nr:hypothetical protein [Gemmataceae bacterium]